MASAPREVEEILRSFQQTFEDIDPTIDITKGPLAVLLYAASEEVSRIEAQVAYLQTMYRLEASDELENDDIDALGRNYGLDPDVGDVSVATVTLFRESRPDEGEAYVVRDGDLVGTTDGRFVFAVVSDASMSGDTPDIYFNADQRRYEISVRAEAVSVGEDFNLPSGTINAFISDIPDFDGVTNYSQAKRGNDPLDKVQFRTLIWNTIQGIDKDIVGNLINTVYDSDPTGFSDVRLVSSSDVVTFERLKDINGKMGYDIYTITDEIVDWLYSFTANGGETSILLDRAPVANVQYVMVDGVQVLFNFASDQSQTVRRSARAKDRVVLSDPLQAGQTVEIKYYYHENVYTANSLLQGRATPFGTDVLVRLGYGIPVFIAAELSTLTADDRDSVINDIQDFTEAYLNDPRSPSSTRRLFGQSLNPRDYQESVLRSVSGIAKYIVTDFNRADTATSDIEQISFDGMTEYPILSPNFVVS